MRQLFAKKKLQELLDEMAGDHRLKRVLGPVSLTALGIGAVIGAGIFVATGSAANEYAGPALMVSYAVAGVTCIFAALCYAEFASMAPVAGSAYTYAYTTMGELFAWIIGWDLVLEYAVGAAAVANGWSGYFQKLLPKLGIILPFVVSGSPYKYDQGHFLPNVRAEYKVADLQKLTVPADKQKADAKPVENWAFSDISVREQPLIIGPVGADSTERLIKNQAYRHATQKYLQAKSSAIWLNGTTPADGVCWVLQHLSAQKIELDKDGDPVTKHETIVLGGVGSPVLEGKLANQQRAAFDLPAILVVILVTLVLIKGIQESAGFNALMVFIKVAVVVFVILVGAMYVNPANWHPFAPYGWSGLSIFGIPILGEKNAGGEPVGMLAGAAIIFFAYIGFDSVSTHSEEAKNPQRDVPIAIMTSLLVCTVLYIGVVAVLTGMVPYKLIDKNAGVSEAFGRNGLPWAEAIIASAGVAGITSVLLVLMLSAPRVFLAMARDGLVPYKFFADVHPKFQTPWKSTILIGVFVVCLAGFLPIDALLHLTNIGTLFAFAIVCGAVLVMRKIDPTAHRPFRCPLVPVVPILGIFTCLMLMLSLPADNWYRLIGWLALGLVIYFGYGRHHSHLGIALRKEISTHGISPGGSPH